MIASTPIAANAPKSPSQYSGLSGVEARTCTTRAYPEPAPAEFDFLGKSDQQPKEDINSKSPTVAQVGLSDRDMLVGGPYRHNPCPRTNRRYEIVRTEADHRRTLLRHHRGCGG
ncbi:hypothetical protein GCM10010439_41020 [Actinocorallia aurantiaca]|uniref:Uncharacterized protein n=1 Tax=Actinocorallia aurantiaca TaxID=46204 RepID=A0ABN3UC92_9ACTN